MLVFGTAIAVAQYAGALFLSRPHVIRVSLVAPGPGPANGTVRNENAGPHHLSSPPVEPHAEHHQEAAEPLPVGPSVLPGIPAPGPASSAGETSDAAAGPEVVATRSGESGGDTSGVIIPEQWIALEAAIERTKNYPRLARERGIEGTVRLRFRLLPTGAIEKLELVESSGSELLDSASIRSVYRAAPMPYVQGWVEVPMAYVLK